MGHLFFTNKEKKEMDTGKGRNVLLTKGKPSSVGTRSKESKRKQENHWGSVPTKSLYHERGRRE